MADVFNIAGRIHSTSQEEVVTTTNEILDETQEKKQSEVNQEVSEELALHTNRLNALTGQNYVTVVATQSTTVADIPTLINASGEGEQANTLYRVGFWDGSAYVADKYTEYAWNGTAYVILDVKSSIGEVFDISLYKAVGGVLATFADLSAALDGGNNVPAGVRQGGMSIKFVQSSDNKYVQYMYLGTSTAADFTDTDNWEKVILEEELDNAVSKWYLNDDKGLRDKIREVYLEGLDVSKEYYLYYQYSSSESKFYISIYQRGDTNVSVAGWNGTTTDGIINLTERNSSGVTGKVLVDGLSTSDTSYIIVDIDNNKVTDTYYSSTIHFSSEISSVRNDVNEEINGISDNLSNRCDDIVGKKDIMYVFSANSPAYTLKYVNFNFVNGGIYKIKITYPTDVNTSTKFSVRGENGSGVVKDNIGTGTGTRTIDYTHQSDAGKTLCLSILDAIVAETSFDVTVETLSGTNLLTLQKGIDNIDEKENDLSEDLENFEKNFCSPVPSSDLAQGSYYNNVLSVYQDRLSSESYYLIPEGKKVVIYSSNTSICKNQFRLQLYDANKNFITGSGEAEFTAGAIDVSSYPTAVYYRFSVLCNGNKTPAMANDIVYVTNGYITKEQFLELEYFTKKSIEKIDKELFWREVSSSELVQGSYYNNYLTVNSKRVSCDEFLPIYPGTTSLEVVINNSALTGGFRFILYDASKNYITGSGTGDAAHGPHDISSWPTAKYYKFSYFNDSIAGGNGNDITPSDCNNVFSVTRWGIWDAVESLDKRTDVLEEELNVIAPDYKTEAVRLTAEIEASNTDLRLLVFADPHSFERYKYIKYAQVNELGGIDGILGLGDYQNYVNANKADCIKGITNMLNAAGRERNCFYAVGNHDASCCLNAEMNAAGHKVLSQSNIMTKQESWRTMQYHLNGLVKTNEADPYGGYFYYDFTAQKIRLIIINASDIYEADGSLTYKYREGVMIKQEQVDWFANKALDFSDKNDASEWSVIVGGHWYFSVLLALLNAAKNGASVSGSYAYNSRYTYDEQTQQWDTPTTSEYVSVNKDFSAQGPINVIGYFFGHTHCDESHVDTGINMLQFVCDNGKLNHMWKTDLPSIGLSAGNYYFSMESGTIIQINLDNDLPTAATIGYNHYFNSTDWTEVFIYNANGEVIWKKNCQETTDPQGTEITGFVDAETTLISAEKCSVVCIDKANRKILAYPYGSASYREISY